MKGKKKRRSNRVDSNDELGAELLYVVLTLHKDIEVTVLGKTQEMPLIYMDGMIGVLPVFKTAEAAQALAGEKYHIQAISAKSPNEKLTGGPSGPSS